MNITRFASYLKTQVFGLVITLAILIILVLFMLVFHVSEAIIVLTIVSALIAMTAWMVADFYRRRNFYCKLLAQIKHLDQAYLALEMMECPKFYDGQILYEAFLRTNKSMLEQVEKYHQEVQNFEEYIELWIHEVKTPLATLMLINNDRKIQEQLKVLDSLVEQVLYYVRAENSEQDYLIKNYNLEEIVNNVIMRNQTLFLSKKIKVTMKGIDRKIYTDAKWCEFVLDQILSNSIKYGSSHIEIVAKENGKSVTLQIIDNGIGIKSKDLPRVFEKSFTGENGRGTPKTTAPRSTGLGLYLVKQLCDKLGHKIAIESSPEQGTSVTLEFIKHDYYDVVSRPNLTKK